MNRFFFFFFFSSRRRHTRSLRDWSSDVCSSDLALLVGNGSVGAVNGFSDNQELPLPPLAPIANSGVSFIVRGLEPSVRVAPDGTVYVSSIRGVPGGVDLHRYAAMDGPPGAGGT